MGQPITKWVLDAPIGRRRFSGDHTARPVFPNSRRTAPLPDTLFFSSVFFSLAMSPATRCAAERNAEYHGIQAKFDVSRKIRPGTGSDRESAFAAVLIEAKNPMLFVGDELSWCGAGEGSRELGRACSVLARLTGARGG